MTKRDLQDDERLVAHLSAAARHAADFGEGPAPAAWHRLQQARAHARAPRRWLLAATAAAGLALAVTGWVARRPRPLTYVVSGGQVEANGYVLRAGTAATELRFSDGTRVRLARGARMSVGTPSPRGARLRVEEGEAHFEVTHKAGADWSVEAGPYRVQVTGTVFDVRWSGAEEAAAVALHVGSVRVSGPHLASPVTLTPGQRLVARLAASEVQIEPGLSGAIADPTTAPLLPVPPPLAPAAGETPAPNGSPRLPKPRPAGTRRTQAPALATASWSARVANGDAASVLAEARGVPFEDVVALADARALSSLADAARFSADPALCARVLTELRRRFPGTTAAATAAFQLGRMADDGGDAHGALDWYRRYEAEAPGGPYAAEALGREMLAVERLSGRAEAAARARAYLARFPDGTYLLQARAILGLP